MKFLKNFALYFTCEFPVRSPREITLYWLNGIFFKIKLHVFFSLNKSGRQDLNLVHLRVRLRKNIILKNRAFAAIAK